MGEIKIELVSDSDDLLWQKYFELCQEISRRHYPAGFDPENTVEKFKKLMQDVNSSVPIHNDYILFEQETPVAWFEMSIIEKDLYFRFDVLSEKVRKHILNAILSKLKEKMKKYSCPEAVNFTFRESIVNTFRNINAAVREEMIISRIERVNMDRSLYESIVNNNELNHWKLKFYDDIPEEILPQFIEFVNGIIVEISKINPYSVRLYTFTPLSWKEMKENQRNFGNTMSIFILFDIEENIAGLCWIYNNSKSKSTIGHNMGLTAVNPKYRGKSIASYLKAKMYLKLLEENKDFKYITTDTMPWNKYMYRINEEFGFKPYRKGTSFKLTEDFLENYLNLK